MSTYFTTAAITICHQRRGEGDRVYTLLAANGGRLEAIADGSGKILSKLAGHLEPFSEAVVTLVQRGTTTKLTGAVCRRRFLNIARTVERMQAAGACLRLCRELIGVGQDDPQPYALLRDALTALDDGAAPEVRDAVPTVFALQLSSLLGWRPQLDRCGRCNAGVASGSFDLPAGALLCVSCARSVSGAAALGIETVQYLRSVLKDPLPAAAAVPASADTRRTAKQMANDLVAYHATAKSA
ncbi:MAG: DNA repair protein RecO [Parcubacteria group bacterium Gr01-1014_31]|nr:MAG: DNA repair protein RecO [Parcubacteria group bacterium Gr01-1014_31]